MKRRRLKHFWPWRRPARRTLVAEYLAASKPRPSDSQGEHTHHVPRE